jgi:LysR family glycine cleavage system transcriptional activator
MRLPPLNALRVFEAAARHGSFARAAEELCVTHVAVSRQIRLLEQRLGIELFVRRHRGVSLTAAGDEYYKALARAFDDIISATQRLTGERGRARLKVETDTALAARWLAPRLPRWRKRHPEIDIEVVPARNVDGPPTPGSVDAVIHYGYAEWAGMNVDRMLKLYAFPVCSPSLAPLLRTPADLAHTVLLHEESTRWWREWLAMVGADAVEWSRGPIFHDTNVLQEAAIRGEGVAIGDNVLWADALAEHRVVRPFDIDIDYDFYDLLIPHASLADPSVAALRAWLLDEAGQTDAAAA